MDRGVIGRLIDHTMELQDTLVQIVMVAERLFVRKTAARSAKGNGHSRRRNGKR